MSITKPFLVFVNAKTFEQLNMVNATSRTYNYIVHLDSNVGNAAFLSYESMIVNGKSSASKLVKPEMHADQTALMLFSSGSTGLPKAVMLSNKLFLYLTKCYRYEIIKFSSDVSLPIDYQTRS